MSDLLLNVDDDPSSRYAISRVLRHGGYSVIEAGTASQALALAREQHPALVLLDVNLPDANGFEVAASIKGDPALDDILVLQHSASFIRPSDQARGLDKGADAYLTVPIEPDVLLATVRSLLRLGRAERALRESARQWRATFDAISDAVALLDTELRIIRCNRSFASLARRPFPDVVGLPWSQALPGLSSIALPRVQVSRDMAVRVDVEAQHEGRWMRVVADPVWSGTGELQGLVCVISDIHGRRLVEEERALLLERERVARAHAEAAGRAKDEFLAVLSHELRTPLNAVLGWARMLSLQTIDPSRIKDAATTIERNARAQAQLIDDLLDISRAVSGNLRLQPIAIDVRDVVASAVEVVQMSANAKGVILEVADDGTQPRVMADPSRLQQVIWNLLSNAIKFTTPGGSVRVAVTRQDEFAEIVVSDSGKGIAQEALPFIFDRFWQANHEGGRPAGLGLGLSIVRHIVESHGGVVEAASEGEGRGATFTVRLPVMREPQTADI